MRILQILLFLWTVAICHSAFAQERFTRGTVTVIFPARKRAQAETAFELYRDAARKVRDVCGLADPGRVTIELADSEVAFKTAYRRLGGSEPPEYALAVAFTPRNVMLIRGTHLKAIGSGSLPETLVHETFHLYLHAMLRPRGRSVPLWFNEGAAQWVAGQEADPQIARMLETAAKGGRLAPLAARSERFPGQGAAVSLAYAQSLSFIKYLESRRPGTVRKALAAISRGEQFKHALETAAGESLANLEAAWRAQLASEYSFLKTFLSGLTLFSVLSLIALVAFARYLVRRKRLRKKLERNDQLHDYISW